MSDEKKPPTPDWPTQPEFELEGPAELPPSSTEAIGSTGPGLAPFLDTEGLSPAFETDPPPVALDGPVPENPLPEEPTAPTIAPPSARASFLAPVLKRLKSLRLSERFERLGVLERLQRLNPGEKLPQKIDTAALAQWAEKSMGNPELSRYGWVSVVLLSSYFLADLASILLARLIPDPPVLRIARSSGLASVGRTLDAYNVIFTRNLFNSRGIIPGDDSGGLPGGGIDLDGPATKTTLPVQLIGTIILKDELRSLATIEDKAASQVYPVRVDDEVPGKFRVLKVQPTRVEFINTLTGKKEYVELPEDSSARAPRYSVSGPKSSAPGIEQTASNQFNVSRSAIDAAMSDLSKVLTQARAIPHNENGQMVGFKLFSIVPGSIYDQLGLKNGDLLCGVNGEPVNDPAKAMTLVTGIKDMSRLELCVKRDGRTQTYNYDIR